MSLRYLVEHNYPVVPVFLLFSLFFQSLLRDHVTRLVFVTPLTGSPHQRGDSDTRRSLTRRLGLWTLRSLGVRNKDMGKKNGWSLIMHPDRRILGLIPYPSPVHTGPARGGTQSNLRHSVGVPQSEDTDREPSSTENVSQRLPIISL